MKPIAALFMIVAVMMFAACRSAPKESGAVADLRPIPNDPASRVMTGTLLSYRPTTSTLLIAAGTGKIETLNNVICKYNKETKFYIDNNPATLDQLIQYMPVTLRGRVTDTHLLIEVAYFSTVLPKNVKREQ